MPATPAAPAAPATPAAPAAAVLEPAVAASQARASPVESVAVAETLLFQTKHLANIHAPATLLYTFHKVGSLEKGFDDRVRLVFDASRAVSLQFLSDERRRPSLELADPEGNPVLLGFLERDIAEMHRLTGGSSSYFRKRIRLALANAAQVQPCRFSFGGKIIEGHEVSIAPYLHDPMRERFEPFVAKRYVFLVSIHVPGGIYQVRTLVPGVAAGARVSDQSGSMPTIAHSQASAAARDPPLIDETSTPVGIEKNRK